ncbi:hypothetical protein SELMODRAFT_130791 [Selaginella moellendorffii]|uniref:CN hydrolase domain-containing protein n=1 Tax=Selaginella moellendorffii TaxID=88036 RepID=D8T2T7_SELML|nr:hypothetical protein SELMODRAFT_130791 [Selaginella moellendorffii]
MRVAVAQMTSTSSIDLNFATCQRLAREAADAGVKLLSLPECFSFIGRRGDEALAIAEPLDGPIFRRYQALARDLGLWLSLGGFQEKGPDEDHAYNTHVLLDDLGSVRSCYRKIHLFDVDVPGGPVLKESNRTAPGTQVVTAQTPVGTLGLTICYDLRFPELYQRLRFAENAQVLLVPSAFTRKTGEAHWELLLRARAVETQCYVLAAAQSGKHNDLRESYGDAMIIDPWGSVVARCPDRLVTGIAVADIDEELLKTVRRNMPIAEVILSSLSSVTHWHVLSSLQHRKYNIYGSDRQLSTL